MFETFVRVERLWTEPRNEMMPMHLIVDLARDLAIVAIELFVLITLGWCLSRNSARDK